MYLYLKLINYNIFKKQEVWDVNEEETLDKIKEIEYQLNRTRS